MAQERNAHDVRKATSDGLQRIYLIIIGFAITQALKQTLTDNNGCGIKITSINGLKFTASHFTDQKLYDTKYSYKLDEVRSAQTFLSLDAIQRGLGNASCGQGVLPKYEISLNTPVTYSFRIESFCR